MLGEKLVGEVRMISRFSEERQRECAAALQEKAQELAERIDPQPFLDMNQ
jgi:hypothetical protein